MDLSDKALDELEARLRNDVDDWGNYLPIAVKAADALAQLRSHRDGLRARLAAAGDSSVCDYVRSVAKELFQGNWSFVIDDIDFMAAVANWALLNGIPDELHPEIFTKAKKAAQERSGLAKSPAPTA